MEHEDDWKEFVSDVRRAADNADNMPPFATFSLLNACADEIERLRTVCAPMLRRPADIVDRLRAAHAIGQTGIAFVFSADLAEAAREIKTLRQGIAAPNKEQG